MSGSRTQPAYLRWFLVLALVAAGAWVFRLDKVRPRESSPGGYGLEPGFGELSSLTIRHGSDSLVIHREGDEFWLVHPLRDRADIGLVREAERQARDLKPERVLPDTTGGGFGLDRRSPGIRLESESGRLWELAVGDTSPVGSGLYARTNPLGPVLILDGFLVRKYFLPAVDQVRDHVAAPVETGPIDSIAAVIPGRSLRIRWESGDRWTALEPKGLEVESGRVSQVLDALRGPMISGFPDPSTPLADLGLMPPRALWVLYQGARAESVRVGRVTPDEKSVYILPAGRSLPAMLGTDFFRNLVDGWVGVANLRLIRAAADSVTEVDFLGGLGQGAYVRESGIWRRNPGERRVERQKALDADVTNLTLARWSRYPVEPMNPGGAPVLQLRLRTASAAETLSLAAVSDTVTLARSTRNPRWGPVPPLIWRVWDFRKSHPE